MAAFLHVQFGFGPSSEIRGQIWTILMFISFLTVLQTFENQRWRQPLKMVAIMHVRTVLK